MTIFYCLRFETPPTWRARSPYLYPPGTGWPGYTPRHWFPFRRLLRLAGLWWSYSNLPPHGTYVCLLYTKSESESYVTTDGQSASLSWNEAPMWGLRQHIYYCQLRVCRCGAVCLTRGRVCRLQLLLTLASAVILGSESCGTRDHVLLSQIRDFPFRRLLRLASRSCRTGRVENIASRLVHCCMLGICFLTIGVVCSVIT
jgi:hypothetical protein